MARYDAMVLLASRETTYGTDAAPVATSNAILMREVTWTPMEADQVERPRVVTYHGNQPVSLHARRARLAGAVDIQNPVSPSLSPTYAPLLRACGLAESLVSGTSIAYSPVSLNEDAATLHHFAEGRRQIGLGGRGDFTIELQAGQVPIIRFDLQAMYAEPTAQPLPAATYAAMPDAIPLGQANTLQATIGANNLILRSLSYTHGNQLVVRDMPGSRAIRITGRQPRATITVEDPDALVPNFFTLIGGAAQNILCRWSDSVGRSSELRVRAQLLNPRYVDESNIRMLQMDLRPVPSSAGNDECQLVLS